MLAWWGMVVLAALPDELVTITEKETWQFRENDVQLYCVMMAPRIVLDHGDIPETYISSQT